MAEDKKQKPISVRDESLFESYEPAMVGEWIVKVSTYGPNQVMVFMTNEMTLEAHLQFFDSEVEAVHWIEYMSAKYV